MLPPRHIAQHLVGWQWTLYRYGCLIAARPQGSPLGLNDLVCDYRYHHMTALSEAFGVGCGLSYALRWLQFVAPAARIQPPVDVEFVLDTGQILVGGIPVPFQPAPNATRRPDYLIAAQQPTGRIRLLVVECKGNSDGRQSVVDQMCTAMFQLEGITFQLSSVGVQRHAYAARVPRVGGSLVVYAVDPSDEGTDWTPLPVVRDDSHGSIGRWENGRLLLPTPEAVAARLLREVDNRTLEWAGLPATTTLELIERVPRRESQLGDLVGATSSFHAPDGHTVEVFTGALIDALRATQTSPHEASERRAALTTRVRSAQVESRRRAAIPFRADEDAEKIASVITDDGLALAISLA